MTPAEFAAKWSKVELTEKSAAQQHFLDLCQLVEHPTPAEADPTGESFTFEKGAAKHGGGDGWADVWKRGFFGWEYKGRHKDLDDAYDQLLLYKDSLENPPLLVVCDLDRIIVHTNFTATAPQKHEIKLTSLSQPRSLEILRNVFHHPDKLRPGVTSHTVTTDAATHFAELANALRSRGLDAHQVAHFLDRIVFCLFAEDIGLLREGLFTDIVAKSRKDPPRFKRLIGQLFTAMATGGDFGADTIRHFNGNLFSDGPVLELTADEIERVHAATELDWGAIDPSILGTLFERGLDPDKRSQLGAHYTSREDIETVVEPVVMQPLRRQWAEVKQTVASLLATGKKGVNVGGASAPRPSAGVGPLPSAGESAKPAASGDAAYNKKPLGPLQLKKARGESSAIIHDFLTRLSHVKVLDPACGSGNFLYVTLQKLKDLEKEVVLHAMETLQESFLPNVGPWQLYGIEINPYAYELAQMTVWIGYLQWTRANGFAITQTPILRPMEGNFFCKDAILELEVGPDRRAGRQLEQSNAESLGAPGGRALPPSAKEPEWPKVDFIVSNPPFLGDKMMRGELGDENVEKLRKLYEGRVPGGADLCCYWFEKARSQIQNKKCDRAGLLATQNIRGGASREVLKRIKETGDIFFGISDRDWVLDGASVHVSMIGFDDGTEKTRNLDGKPVPTINANLSSAADTTAAQRLAENSNTGFIGSCKGGSFDIEEIEAFQLLRSPGNPHGKPNSDVVRPVINSEDLMLRRPQRWIIDYADLSLDQASYYEKPMLVVVERVKPHRDSNRDKWLRDNWWRPQRMRPEMRKAIQPLSRFLVTPTTSKHRAFAWLHHATLPDHKLVVFGRDDDFFFGLVYSRVHEAWARAQGTQLRARESGLNYNVQSSFETFPFPEPTAEQQAEISAAAKELDALRQNWLNPPEWVKEEILEFPASVNGPWARYIVGQNSQKLQNSSYKPNPVNSVNPVSASPGTARYPRLIAKDAECAKKLAKRTLTNLYNERPTWLDLAHKKLDEKVFAAYGWPATLSDDELLAKLLALNLERAKKG